MNRWFLQAVEASTATAQAAAAAAASAGVAVVASLVQQAECPPDKLEIGRATWTYLHSMAAYFPEKPSAEQRQAAVTTLQSMSLLYPCGYCASHLRDYLHSNPVNANTRNDLAQWLCNMVRT